MRFVRPREVLEMIGVSRTTLWRMVQSGAFPPPVRITTRNNGFVLEAVEEWMKARTMGLPWQPPVQPESTIRLAQIAVPRAASGAQG
jgi:prophage regulatory protein